MLKLFATLAPSVLNDRRYSCRAIQTAFTTASFAGAMLISGCGAGRMLPNVSSNAVATSVRGTVHGGQQPVSGALIQLWAAGAAGNGSAATPLLTSAVYTDATGGFGITGDYSCPSATTQVYMTATGGNPGLSGNVNNGELALAVALGDCAVLPTVPSVSISELTTVAAAYALAPFASGVDHVGASATNLAGLRSAMQTAMLLVNPYDGAPAENLPANATTETAKLITLGNVLAGCVNSDGSQICSQLANDAFVLGYALPADTFQDALMVAQHPGSNVAAVFNDAPAQAAFGGGLTSAPSDWTMSIAYTGGGLGHPNAVSIDGQGEVWVSNYYGGVSGFNAQGTPMFAAGVTSGMGLSSAATVDATGVLWVANGAYDLNHMAGSVARVAGDGTVLSGAQGFTSGGINLPDSIAALPNGTIAVVNAGDSLLTMLGHDGTVLSGANGYGGGVLSTPSALAVDGQSNLWITNKANGTLVELDPSGNVLLQANCGGSPDSIAIDSNGTLWVGDSTAGTVTEVRSDGAISQVLGGQTPAVIKALTIDGGGHLFAAEAQYGVVIEVHDSSYAAPGSVVGDIPGLGQDALLNAPAGMAADSSGNLWVTSSGDNRLVGFIGLATPVSTPHVGLPVLP